MDYFSTDLPSTRISLPHFPFISKGVTDPTLRGVWEQGRGEETQ